MATVFDPNKKNPTQLQTIGTATPAGPVTTSQAAPAAQQPQGSGRFTNIQKYLGANKAGGQQVASKIGSNIQQDLTKQQDATKKYNEQLGQSVQKAGQVAQQGAGFQQKLGEIGTEIGAAKTAGYDARNNQQFSNLQNFTQSPDFNQFQDIQAGRGIDEDLLNLQQQKAAQTANIAAQSAQTAQGQLASEGGRFELLRKTFGGAARPGYGQGQQRLDQVLLGQGGGLGQVQGDVGAKARELQQLSKATGAEAGNVNRLAQQERDLISGINTQTGANEEAYLNMLGSYVDPLNQQRATEVQNLGKALGSYNQTYDPANPGLTADQMSKLGLTDSNQGVYNVFKNQQYADPTGADEETKRRNMASFAAKIGREAGGYQDVANQSDVDRYSQLSKMMGANARTNLTKASDLEAAYGRKGAGEGDLKEQLDSAQKAFDASEKIKSTTSLADRYVSGVNTAGKYNIPKLSKAYGEAGVNDLIKSGKVPTDMYNETTGTKITDNPFNVRGKRVQDTIDTDIYSKLQKYLQEQNYGQTLGGRRETWLDSDPKYSVANPKLSAVPITGYDPSKAGTK